jgi:hypothetical protein
LGRFIQKSVHVIFHKIVQMLFYFSKCLHKIYEF